MPVTTCEMTDHTDEQADRAIAEEIIAERRRQDARFGRQRLPSLSPLISGNILSSFGKCFAYGLPSPDDAREDCETAFKEGHGSWAHIAKEEFCEAIGADTDADRREELVQAAAVIMAWIADLDRKAAQQ